MAALDETNPTAADVDSGSDKEADSHPGLSRGEKKARKALAKLGLKPIPGFTKCELKRSRQLPICIRDPFVVEIPGKTPTYVVLGPLRVDDYREEFARQAQMLKANAAAPAAATKVEAPPKPAVEEPEADAEGLNESDIKLAMEQTGRSRNEVIAGLRKTNGDLIEAIMHLTS